MYFHRCSTYIHVCKLESSFVTECTPYKLSILNPHTYSLTYIVHTHTHTHLHTLTHTPTHTHTHLHTHTGVFTDEDECALMTHDCSGVAACVNTVGSFYCSCPPGYTISPEGNTCLGIYYIVRKLLYNLKFVVPNSLVQRGASMLIDPDSTVL